MKAITSARSNSQFLLPLALWAAVVAGSLAFAPKAHAAFHLWNISELYTNSSGTLQFIELSTTASGQNFVGGQQIHISFGGQTQTPFTVPSNLSTSTDTSNKEFLIGTAGIQAAGAPAPDFVMPNGFLFLGGGTISFPTADEADIRRRFDYAKNAGMPLIVAAPHQDVLPKLEKFVKEYDIKLAVHNHGPEDHEFPTPQSILERIGGMDPRVGLCIDVGHTARTGKDVVQSIREAGARLLDMHIKDLRNFHDRDSQVPVGDGIMPIPGIFRELTRMQYKGGVMLEYEIDEDDPVPGMLRSFAYMRGVLAGMRA